MSDSHPPAAPDRLGAWQPGQPPADGAGANSGCPSVVAAVTSAELQVEKQQRARLVPDRRAGSGHRWRWLRFGCWGIALLVGAFDACYRPFAMGANGGCPDAVAYLDIAQAYARGDWAHALNAYWSPLYCWLLALTLHLLHPRAAAEVQAAHLLNVLLFGAALAAFDYFWSTWSEEHASRTAAAGPAFGVSLSPEARLLIGYALFTWSSIRLIGVELMTPDMLLSALVYLATALTLRLRRGDGRLAMAVLLGVVLGLGFLAKAVMLPLSAVFMLVAFLPAHRPRRTAVSLFCAGCAFLMVIAPFVVALSRHEGRLTTGDTGRLNYAWFVNGTPQLDWQGEPDGQGRPLHPTHVLYPSPPVYEFAGPIGGTYPVWTEPAYWYVGLAPRFILHHQVGAVRRNLIRYRRNFRWSEQSGPAVGIFLLLFTSAAAAKRRFTSLVRGDLLLLALAPALLYALVVVDPRYLGASIVLGWLAFLPAARLPARRTSQILLVSAVAGMLLTLGMGVARGCARDLRHPGAGADDWDTATRLSALGLRAGDRVGCIGFSWGVGWARLARVRIVAHVPTRRVDEYWSARPAVRRMVLRAFAKAGARAVLTEHPPAGAIDTDWYRLGATDRYVRFLRTPSRSPFAVPGGPPKSIRRPPLSPGRPIT